MHTPLPPDEKDSDQSLQIAKPEGAAKKEVAWKLRMRRMVGSFKRFLIQMNTSPTDAEFQDLHKLTRFPDKLRLVCRETKFLFEKEDVSTRSASLTYSVILSLVPLLAIAFTMFQFFGGLKVLMDQTLAPLIRDNFGKPGDQIVGILQSFVENLSVSTLGPVSFATFLVTVIFLLLNIERHLNSIFHAKKERSFLQSSLNYWVLITLTPLVIVLSSTKSTELLSQFEFARELLDSFGVLKFITFTIGFIAQAFGFSFIYYMLPAEKPSKRAILITGLIASFSFELLQFINVFLTKRSLSDSSSTQIYGSIPLIAVAFFFWLRLVALLLLGCACLGSALNRYFNSADGKIKDTSGHRKPIQPLFDCSMIFGIILEEFANSSEGATKSKISRRTGMGKVDLESWTNYLLDQKLIFSSYNARDTECFYPTHNGLRFAESPERFLMEVLLCHFGFDLSKITAPESILELLPAKALAPFTLEIMELLRKRALETTSSGK
jgi:YihY family inner membrane protein